MVSLWLLSWVSASTVSGSAVEAPKLPVPPAIVVDWRGGYATIQVEAPPGQHASPDAPSSWRMTGPAGEWRVDMNGSLDGASLRIPRGHIAAEASVAFCDDVSGSCRMWTLRGEGLLGVTHELVLHARVAAAPGAAPGGEAPSGGGIRLYDFGAVWCPPCNLLNAEILENPARAGALAGLELVPLDVDRPESFELKDRYDVGGYPSLVAVAADGTEIDRLVGYPGLEPTLSWLAGLSRAVPIAQLAAADSPALTGREAAAAARRLAEADQLEAAARYVTMAGTKGEGEDLRIARLLLTPSAEDAAWLFEHAAAGDWVYAALKVDPNLRLRLGELIGSATPAQAADYFALAAEGASPELAAAYHAAALSSLSAALTGDPKQDKGHQIFLAELYVQNGRLDEAIRVLDRADAAFPDELTFVYAKARFLVEQGRFTEAEAPAREAHRRAWGDQRYRTAMMLANALKGLGKVREAVRVLDAVLAEQPAPTEDVRARSYRKKVEELRAGMTGSGEQVHKP